MKRISILLPIGVAIAAVLWAQTTSIKTPRLTTSFPSELPHI